MDLLYRNLSIMISFEPSLSNPVLSKSIYKNLFQVPDHLAFQQIVHFLLNVICPKKCKNAYSWPLDRVIDKGCERKFLTAIRSIIMELKEEYPRYGVPNFTTSFLSNPCGPKFTCLMIKLSVIALDLHVQHSVNAEMLVEDCAAINPCLEIQIKIIKQEEMHQRKVLHQTDMYIKELRVEAANLASSICDKMKSTSNEIKYEEMELSNWLTNNLVIPEEMKSSLLDVCNQQVIMVWKAEIENKQQNTAKTLEKLKELDCRMDDAYKTIQTVLVLRKANLCLDGSKLNFNITEASLEALVPAIKNLQLPLHTEDGTMVLNSLVHISNECLKVLIDAMEEKGVLNYIRSYPHTAIKDQSLRLNRLSATGKSMLLALSSVTTMSNQFINSTIDNYEMTDSDEEWMKPYHLEDLVPPLPFVPHQYCVPQEPDGIVNAIPGSMLIESSDHEVRMNAILACRLELSPPEDFFTTSPVKHWINQLQKSETADVPTITGNKPLPKASRLPVLCSSARKYTSSVVVRSRLEYSCKKVNNVIREEHSVLDVTIVPTPNAKSNGLVHLPPVLSPLATELPKTPAPISVHNIDFVKENSNTPDILNHTYTSPYSDSVLVTPISGATVDVITYMDNEFDESNVVEICNLSDFLNSGLLSQTESEINISKKSSSCVTPSNCSAVHFANSDLKRKNSSVSSEPIVSQIQRSSTPAEKNKDKTPSTLERIISRYKKFKESKK